MALTLDGSNASLVSAPGYPSHMDLYNLLNSAKVLQGELEMGNANNESLLEVWRTILQNFSDSSDGQLSQPDFLLSLLASGGSNESFKVSSAFRHNFLMAQYPSQYTLWEVVCLAILMTAMMIVIVVGNLLVVIAIATENSLAALQNWFVASLAVSDMMIGLMIMPFSLSNELMGYWMFGSVWCDIHGAMDVFLCTASIMNICLISLDRYWSIVHAVDYLNARTPFRAGLMIVIVWILSGLISIPPLLDWNGDENSMQWFWDIINSSNNQPNNVTTALSVLEPNKSVNYSTILLSQFEFLIRLHESGHIDLHNFTTVLESVVYPQCGVS